jgi:hypothetical protein
MVKRVCHPELGSGSRFWSGWLKFGMTFIPRLNQLTLHQFFIKCLCISNGATRLKTPQKAQRILFKEAGAGLT